MADSSKTEKATPKKRRDERKKGHVFMSQDAVSVATLIGASAVLFFWAGKIVKEVSDFISFCIQKIAEGQNLIGIMPVLGKRAIIMLAKTCLPGLLVTTACAILATFGQTRMLVSSHLLKPQFSRLNPIQGFKKLFSLRSLVEAVKNILKIILLVVVIVISLKGILGERSVYLYTEITASCTHFFEIGRGMIIKIIVVFIILAAADFGYQYWSFEKDMKMSKQEVKEEYKMTEGDPQIKGKIKEMQRKRAMSRMMQQVPQADVVIRNPTHFAVALRYHPDKDFAPVVLAKGQDDVALRIVKIAENAGIPAIENVPLARVLYAKAELNCAIPQEFYGPVAEVLVYIFKLNDRHQLVK